ncbi:aminotransferase class I/II-fold pyridoxal phosphate-dependent enzyme [Staphylococcus succinus]|uniref:aminotransferase class I/II-fold pyridoxal phosphate-dependent enzyme n=2 Tax=Staphylococcus succinus TaxID=61015 RepID=UPI00129060C5|nr:aminotransferase class I/II-fold pyridoxal phosphate-dependent enzyme [Staphylococcus succinus]MDH9161092.1 aminotransferase class I/II-fold pyridoxal phosphate-dependent enzyme [Staphylococcus succinus]
MLHKNMYIASLSKILNTGLRVCFLACSPKFAKSINNTILNSNIKTSSLNVEISIEMIINLKINKVLEERLNIIKTRNKIFEKYFQEDNQNTNQHSFYKWVEIPHNIENFEEIANRHGVKVYEYSRFSLMNLENPKYIRISLIT